MNRTFKKFAGIFLGTALALVVSGCTASAKDFSSKPPQIEPRTSSETLVQDDEPTETPIVTPFAEEAPASEEVEVIEEDILDRTKPIYEVYKKGYLVTEATTDVQWIIRDFSEQYDLPEKMIYGLICAESTFVPDLESFDGGCWGLAQINTFWITRANITHFTDDYRARDLCNPYDNLLTLAEMMCYARDTYGLDYSVRADLVKYLYWHNTGHDPSRVTRWDYATRALGYAEELVTLQS